MFASKIGLVGLLSVLMMFSTMSISEAELWELVIEANVEKTSVHPNEPVKVTGKVVDHAYNPIRGAEVLIRAGGDTTKAFTDPWGVFAGELTDMHRVPGTYKVYVVGTWYGMTGLTNTEFQVKGDSSHVTDIQRKLSTEEARKYLSSNENDFERNPIGQTLFKYYHNLLEELIKEKRELNQLDEGQIEVEKQRILAKELKVLDIEEFNPGAGKYEGYRHDYYISSLDPKIRDMITTQLNFTKNHFEEAQKIKEEILAEGGTYEEARKAYLEKISISKKTLEEFNQKKTDSEEIAEDDKVENTDVEQ